MRKGTILLFVSVLLFGSCTNSQTKNKKLEEFVMDLPSANVKLRGQLKLFGKYKGDLSTLTYEHYLVLLKENESASNTGLSQIIKDADKHVFVAKDNSFLIAIYSDELKAILYDDANTPFTDSILVIQKNTKIPDLNDFIKKSGFNNP